MALSKKHLTLEEICEQMPKLELHAHLNGSVSDDILQRLKNDLPNVAGPPPAKQYKSEANTIRRDILPPEQRNHADCWISFGKIADAIRTPQLLYKAACLVIEDFTKDNVIYLELRTTPKKIHEIPSKKVYIETVIRAIKDCKNVKKLPIIVKLLISVDRAYSSRNQLENVCLAKWFSVAYPDVVVGLDLCGNAHMGDLRRIMFTLNFARKLGMRFSLHLSEVRNLEECKRFLEFCPERVAHGQFLHVSNGGSAELWDVLKNSGACMEVCISSNYMTGLMSSWEDSYVKFLHQDNIPYVICTDDSGVFHTSVSNEFKRLMDIVPISQLELKLVTLRSIDFAFGTPSEKAKLMAILESWWKENLEEGS